MLTENNWMIYHDGHMLAYKRVEADIHRINMLITGNEEGNYFLAIEAGMDSISVTLEAGTMEEACTAADEFAKAYFRDKAKLLEEIADRI